MMKNKEIEVEVKTGGIVPLITMLQTLRISNDIKELLETTDGHMKKRRMFVLVLNSMVLGMWLLLFIQQVEEWVEGIFSEEDE